MDQQAFAECEATVRAHDPDRYFSALFAPASRRPFLFALYAFNHEVARVAETAREPMMAAIRLEWWRETVEAAKAGKPRAHPVAKALAALFAACDLPVAPLEALIAARGFDAGQEGFADFAALENYVDATSGNLMRSAARILGSGADAREAGLAYGLCGLLRSFRFHARRRKYYLPEDLLTALELSPDALFSESEKTFSESEKIGAAIRQISLRARDHYRAARALPKPGAGLPALMPATLAPLYLKGLEKEREVSVHRRQMALLGAAVRGRV